MILSQESNMAEIIAWLNKNLLTTNRIQACCKLTEKVPTSRGLYFWFVRQNQYSILSTKIRMERLAQSYTLKINDEEYDLVYIGSAGTGKQRNSNLQERLKWHICQAHTNNNICHGTLSTLRTGLSALIANDLIITDTENQLNKVLCESFYVYWIEYLENSDLIDFDEKILISQIRPIFNIKNNPNARSIADENSTLVYRRRRSMLIKVSKKRLNCAKESDKVVRERPSPTKDTPLYAEQIINETSNSFKNCIEYFVLQDQDIAEITRGIPNLHEGKVEIMIYNSKNRNEVFDLWDMKKTGNDDDVEAQNIYTYFSNTCTNRLHHIAKTRNKVISWWMKENKIDEITVRICWNEPVIN